MGLWTKLFGEKPPARAPRDVAAVAATLVRPALQLVAGLPVRSAPPVHSWFLGEPDLPSDVSWPERDGRRLAHLVTLDLADARAALSLEWLSTIDGALTFFYDLEKQPYGRPKDRGAWRVIHRASRATSRSPDSVWLRFNAIRTYPPPERAEPESLGFDDAEWDLYCGLEEAQTGIEYCHKLGGYQSLIQGDRIELQSQFALHGLDFDGDKSANSERGRELATGAAQWRLLLQLATDDALGWMWGDAGNLYFMIREADARAGRFDDVWLIGECF